MSDLLATTALTSPPRLAENPPQPTLTDLIGNRWSYQQIAAALQCTDRAVYNLIEKHKIPYIRVLNKRYVEPAAIRAAVVREQVEREPRGRGRPRKAA